MKAPPIWRVVLDLNVLVAALLSQAAGRTASPSWRLAAWARDGRAPTGPLQLICSQAMLDRLELVVVRKGLLRLDEAQEYVAAWRAIALAGPLALAPFALIGGGVLPLNDVEDQGVLEVAIAGRAHLLVTGNWDDFAFKDVEVQEPRQRARYRDLWIVSPSAAVAVLEG